MVLTKGTIADGSTDCKRTGDEVNSFRKLLTIGAGNDGSTVFEVVKEFMSAIMFGGGANGNGIVEDSEAISPGNKPPNAEPE